LAFRNPVAIVDFYGNSHRYIVFGGSTVCGDFLLFGGG
jgi:hypothetical protein